MELFKWESQTKSIALCTNLKFTSSGVILHFHMLDVSSTFTVTLTVLNDNFSVKNGASS